MTAAREVARFLAGSGKPALVEFLSRQRWFAAKARGIQALEIEDWAALRSAPPLLLLLVNVDGDRYYVPLSATPGPPEDPRRQVARFGEQTIRDAHWDPDFGRLLLAMMASGVTVAAGAGRFAGRPMPPWPGPSPGEMAALPVCPLGGEQSNTSLVFDRVLILKSFRRPRVGINPDFEITHFLSARRRFAHVAPLEGWIDYAGPNGEAATIAVLQRFVDNGGDGWEYTLAGLRRLCEAIERAGEAGAAAEPLLDGLDGNLLADARTLGAVTGGLHAALASDPASPDFHPEPITDGDTARWSDGIIRDFELLRADLALARHRLAPGAESALSRFEQTAGRIGEVVRSIGVLADGQTHKIRCHGDYHLGQVLKTHDAFLVIDFEGEPARPLEERRRKHAALRDVAGMLRSFNYAVHAVARERAAAGRPPLLGWLERWEEAARRAFLDGYVGAASGSPVRLVPAAPALLLRACAVFELEKAGYELRYELNNRPDWVSIPLAGIRRVLEPRPD
ncbi:MAG TPA: hypothetical protein VGT40_23440 [Methylomirabilota bacterium]|jgi:maltose alpha-D-glucosyltransferase/alpha-amylase|nr:hypothetical protein [Methylomirabilota bacterium]